VFDAGSAAYNRAAALVVQRQSWHQPGSMNPSDEPAGLIRMHHHRFCDDEPVG